MLGAGSYIRELELENKCAMGARGRARLHMKHAEETGRTEAVIREKLEEAKNLHRQEVSEIQEKLRQSEELCRVLEEENKLIASQSQQAIQKAQQAVEEQRRETLRAAEAHESQLRELQDEVSRLKASLEEERTVSLQTQLQHIKQIEDLKMVHLKELEDKAAATEAEVKESFSAGVWSQLEYYLPQFQQGFDWPGFKAFLDQRMEEDDALERRIREEEARMQTGESTAAGGHPDADISK